MVAFACSVGVAKVQERQDPRRGKGSRKTGSTPPVVPGAAPALAKARVGGFFTIPIEAIWAILCLGQAAKKNARISAPSNMARISHMSKKHIGRSFARRKFIWNIS